MAIPGLPKSAPPLDLAAMEERLKRFDAEREAANTWLKSNFPDLAEVFNKGAAPATSPAPAVEPPANADPVIPAGGSVEDVYERLPQGYHMRGDAMQRALANDDCDTTGVPAVGRPQRKLRSFAEALEVEGKKGQDVLSMMAEGFAENDLIDYMRDSSAKAGVKAFERGFQDREHMYQYERDNERRAVTRGIQEESSRQKDDLERTRRDDELRQSRDVSDRQRRDAEDATRRQRDVDTQSAKRDAERRDQEVRDQQRRLEEDRVKTERDRS